MKERPIIFCAPTVRAILDDQKTKTRRVIKPQPETPCFFHLECVDGIWRDEEVVLGRCPQGEPGDRLWVREVWAHRPGDESCAGWGPWYRADSEDKPPHLKCRPSIFMPRWASRITLEIVDVSVERLQDISEEDAWREGFHDPDGTNREYSDRARYWFRNLWGHINGPESWDANPYVWVIEFRKLKGGEQ